MTKATVDRLVLAGFVLLSVFLYLSTDSFTGIAQKTSAKYVRFLAICCGSLSLVQLGISILKRDSSGRLVLTEHLPRFLGLIAALILFGLCFKPLGFFIPAAVFVPAVMVMLGQRNFMLIAGTTVGLLGFVYLIFVLLLGVTLPGPSF